MLLCRLEAVADKEKFVTYATAYSKLCASFQLHKPRVKELLFLLHDLGLIELSRRGLTIKYEVGNES